jgi:hypothetical protein
MDQDWFRQIFDTRLTRRSALQTAGAVGAAGILAPQTLMSAGAQGGEDPFEYPDLAITAVEYAFEMPATAEAGWTHVTLDNQGMMDHHAMFLRPHEGSTIEDVQAALEGGDFGAILAAAMSVGGPNVGPMHQASVVMNLEVGQYLVVCVIPDEEGIPHFALGMQTLLDVTEGSTESTPPEADVTVNLIEMAFEGLPTEAPSGTHVLEIANTGTQLHEIVILQLAEGVTIEQAMQGFMEPLPPTSPVASPVVDQAVATPVVEAPGGPPFVAIAGVAPISPGETNYAVFELVAGDYIAICFVPDAETGAPHFAMGMITGFTVT